MEVSAHDPVGSRRRDPAASSTPSRPRRSSRSRTRPRAGGPGPLRRIPVAVRDPLRGAGRRCGNRSRRARRPRRTPRPEPEPDWSAWGPTGRNSRRTKQIADRVAKGYRLDNGEQLALPDREPTDGRGPPATSPSARSRCDRTPRPDRPRRATSTSSGPRGATSTSSAASGRTARSRRASPRRNGTHCSGERPWSSRSTRSSTSTASTPSPSSCRRDPTARRPATTVFLRRSDLKKELRKPLLKSIGISTPTMGQAEARAGPVNRITGPRLYPYEYQQAQDGGASSSTTRHPRRLRRRPRAPRIVAAR